VRIHAVNVGLVGVGQRLLRLDYLKIVGHAGGKAVARLSECLASQIHFLSRDFNLLRGSLQIEESFAHFGINLAAQIVQLIAALGKHRAGLLGIRRHFAALEDGDVQRGVGAKRTV